MPVLTLRNVKTLRAGIDVVFGLLPDIHGSDIIINTFVCFPDTSVATFEKMFCTACMDSTLGKEDLADQGRLRQKLMVPPDIIITRGGSG